MLITELKIWLKKDGNSKTKLAMLLNYKSTNVIDKWIRNGEVPRREVERVNEIIRKEG